MQLVRDFSRKIWLFSFSAGCGGRAGGGSGRGINIYIKYKIPAEKCGEKKSKSASVRSKFQTVSPCYREITRRRADETTGEINGGINAPHEKEKGSLTSRRPGTASWPDPPTVPPTPTPRRLLAPIQLLHNTAPPDPTLTHDSDANYEQPEEEKKPATNYDRA